jgi:hypothetical protein
MRGTFLAEMRRIAGRTGQKVKDMAPTPSTHKNSAHGKQKEGENGPKTGAKPNQEITTEERINFRACREKEEPPCLSRLCVSGVTFVLTTHHHPHQQRSTVRLLQRHQSLELSRFSTIYWNVIIRRFWIVPLLPCHLPQRSADDSMKRESRMKKPHAETESI